MSRARKVAMVVGIGAAGSAALLLSDSDRALHLQGYYRASYRIYNLVATTAAIAYDYKFCVENKHRPFSEKEKSRLEAAFEETQSRQEKLMVEFHRRKNSNEDTRDVWSQLEAQRAILDEVSNALAALDDMTNKQLSTVHTRNAKRLTQMCLHNEGIYIKLGQHLAMLDYIIPVEYQNELTKLLANNLHSSWDEVDTVLKEDIGTEKLLGFFDKIEREPIASASLAQVHVALGKDGKKYAIKVQHKDLREESVFDRKAVTFVVNGLSDLFPEFQFKWLTREMNRNIPLEMDFLTELSNSEACRQCFKSLIMAGSVCVPETKGELCSGRVLTMSFEEGCFATDIEGISKAGLRRDEVARLISTVFSEQM
jgi:predicted unusual protein kinase regulating ubiquinone biosynthesis (AarF/ABC1/UbiB family)